MHWLTLLMHRLGWPAPAVLVPKRVPRLRMECDVCGKRLAVVASTHRVWRHRCVAPPDWGGIVPDTRTQSRLVTEQVPALPPGHDPDNPRVDEDDERGPRGLR